MPTLSAVSDHASHDSDPSAGTKGAYRSKKTPTRLLNPVRVESRKIASGVFGLATVGLGGEVASRLKVTQQTVSKWSDRKSDLAVTLGDVIASGRKVMDNVGRALLTLALEQSPAQSRAPDVIAAELVQEAASEFSLTKERLADPSLTNERAQDLLSGLDRIDQRSREMRAAVTDRMGKGTT